MPCQCQGSGNAGTQREEGQGPSSSSARRAMRCCGWQPRKGQQDRVRPGEWGWDSSPRVWPNPGSTTTPILGDPDLTRLLVTLGDGPEALEVPSHLCSSGMRMGWGERSGWPHSQAQRATVPSPSPTGQAGGGLGRCSTPQRCFPPRRARSPEREKEEAEGLGKKTPGSVDNINERLSHRDCF